MQHLQEPGVAASKATAARHHVRATSPRRDEETQNTVRLTRRPSIALVRQRTKQRPVAKERRRIAHCIATRKYRALTPTGL